jgi:PAS domain S-box-containing protein
MEFEKPIKRRTASVLKDHELLKREIAERRKLEGALRKSEEKFGALVENSLDGIAVVQEERILFVNRVLLEMFGCQKADEMVGHPFTEFVSPEHRDLMVERGRTREKGEYAPSDYEFKALRKDGSRFDAELSVGIITFEGQAARQAVLRDITERKRAEEALKESEDKYRTILESIEEGYYEVDISGNLTFFNDSLCRIHGYSRDELMGMNYRQYADEETAKKVHQAFNRVYSTGKPAKGFDWEHIRKDGTKARAEISVSLMKDAKGQRIGFRGIMRDITERRRAEDALKESEQRYRTLVESSTDAILMTDKERKAVTCNQAFLNLFGYEKREIEGKSIRIIHQSDESFASFGKTAYPSIEKGDFFRTEWEFMHKDGTTVLPVEIVKSAVRSPDGSIAGYIAVIRDITERKRAEEERGRLETQLLQSEKMASIGQLAAGVAHEINNPTGFVSSNLKTLSDYQNDMLSLIKEYRNLISDLRANLGNTQVLDSLTEQAERIGALESEVDIDFIMDDTPNLIKDCQEGTERIKKIVIDLKDFAHPGEQKFQYADINKNLDSTLNVVWNELKYKATVTKEYGELPEVKCYPQQLNQVFMNLLVNAAQAIEKEGEIRISTQALDGQVQIRISDSGSGIPKENLSRIFDPFFTTKEVGKGTGLGLNVAYNIIQKHKGTIDVESEVGRGTTFTIRLQVEAGLESNENQGRG